MLLLRHVVCLKPLFQQDDEASSAATTIKEGAAVPFCCEACFRARQVFQTAWISCRAWTTATRPLQKMISFCKMAVSGSCTEAASRTKSTPVQRTGTAPSQARRTSTRWYEKSTQRRESCLSSHTCRASSASACKLALHHAGSIG